MASGHVLVPRPIREQAVIPHAVEAAREHMQEDAPDELRRGQGHGLLTRCVGTAVVGVAEPDLPRVEGEEPLVGDGDPMRVPTAVIEHLVGPGEGWLGVDHPVGLPGGLEMGGKVLPIVEGVEGAGEVQLAGLERLAHGVEQQPVQPHGTFDRHAGLAKRLAQSTRDAKPWRRVAGGDHVWGLADRVFATQEERVGTPQWHEVEGAVLPSADGRRVVDYLDAIGSPDACRLADRRPRCDTHSDRRFIHG